MLLYWLIMPLITTVKPFVKSFTLQRCTERPFHDGLDQKDYFKCVMWSIDLHQGQWSTLS